MYYSFIFREINIYIYIDMSREWAKLKRPDEDLADITIVAIARGCKKDILIFNTNPNISHSPIYVVRAEEYPGVERDSNYCI